MNLRTVQITTTHWMCAAALIAGLTMTTAATSAAPFIDIDFNNLTAQEITFDSVTHIDTNTGTGLKTYVNSRGWVKPVEKNNSTKHYATNNNGVGVGTASFYTIPTLTEFSMFGGYNTDGYVNTTLTGGGLGFGWTTSTTQFDTYNAPNINITAGIEQMAGTTPTYQLAWGNGISKQMTNALTSLSTTENTNAPITLTAGNWYLLYGTIARSGDDFTVTLYLDDFGHNAPNGSVVAANILSGSATFTVTGFATEGAPLFITNSGRGFMRVDNLYANAIPEPATLALLGCGLAMIGIRRRRHA